MLYMTIATWKTDKRDAIIKRLLEKGRMRPKGQKVIGEWNACGGGRMFSVTEGVDDASMMQVVLAWSDLMEFEIIPVMDSQALEKILKPKR